MKLNRRVGDTLNLVKKEYESEYLTSSHADVVGDYLHALCSYYALLIGKNISLSNPVEFACKHYRMYLQGLLLQESTLEDQSLASVYYSLNELILKELESSKIRQKENKELLWRQYSTSLLEQFLNKNLN